MSFRFQSLREPLQERRASLEAQRLLLQFFRDADEEMAWVQEKLPSATAQDYGQSLNTVRHLQEKHQVLAHAGRLGKGSLRGDGGSWSKDRALWTSTASALRNTYFLWKSWDGNSL